MANFWSVYERCILWSFMGEKSATFLDDETSLPRTMADSFFFNFWVLSQTPHASHKKDDGSVHFGDEIFMREQKKMEEDWQLFEESEIITLSFLSLFLCFRLANVEKPFSKPIKERGKMGERFLEK